MPIDNWDEIRTAFQVARIGTVSGAAEALGVHHATVIRHVDALEQRLGTKLFQRHPRGYTPTEAGQQILAVGQATEDQFSQLAARIAGAGEEVSGELIVTSVLTLSGMVLPALKRLIEEHPALRLRYLTDARVFRLEYGEAHIAVRAGNRPTEPDNVVQPLAPLQVALFASKEYLADHGKPEDETARQGHRFIANDSREGRAPYLSWLAAMIPEQQVVFRANDHEAQWAAIREGIGMGFLPVVEARMDPLLEEVMPPREEWAASVWLVTHVDLHRTPKVQAALRVLKETVAEICPNGL